MTIRVAINGKFLSCKTGGIIRVATRVLERIDEGLRRQAELRELFDFQLLVPPGASLAESYQHIRVNRVGRFRGQAWEQLEFPLYARGCVGLNFTSTGPVLKRDCVSVIHDAQAFRTPRSFPWQQRLLHRVLNSLNGHLHKRIITVSEYSRSELEHFWVTPPRKATVIPNAADHLSHCEPDDSILDRLQLRGRKFVLANAYAQAHKNVALLFAAMDVLSRPAVELVLFGKVDPQRFAYLTKSQLARAKLAGRVSDGELRALYEHASVFAFPSKTEGFGLPPLEAMSIGCPCLVSDAGAMPEVLRNGAAYASPEDPVQWARRIAQLLDDGPLVERLRRYGYEVASSYSWESTADRYLAVIQDLAAEGVH